MPRGRPKKKVVADEVIQETATPSITRPSTEKERLLALYKELQDLKVTSLSNLENRIAAAE
mgnify:CR=1 FL=1